MRITDEIVGRKALSLSQCPSLKDLFFRKIQPSKTSAIAGHPAGQDACACANIKDTLPGPADAHLIKRLIKHIRINIPIFRIIRAGKPPIKRLAAVNFLILHRSLPFYIAPLPF